MKIVKGRNSGLLALLLVLLPASSRAYSSTKFEAGVPTNKVVVLNKENVDSAIKDPANSFWLLKFYAPWCGHCKKLAPVLDKVAPKTAGQMSIGTIDCTTEKKLCDQHKVRGYPTLKFALDGEVYEYPGGRKERDFLDFSTKMLRPIVDLVETIVAANNFAADKTEEGVAFLAYHPALVSSTKTEPSALDDKLQSTLLTQVFAQVARKQRAVGSFILLDTSATEDDESAAAVAAELGQEGPFICRLEANVAPRCFDKVRDDNINMADLLQWVEKQNVATVSHLGAHNFPKIGRSGRPLVIAVVSEKVPEELETAKRELARYAVSGAANIRDKYYYGWFDGETWKRFLEQFEVKPKDTPQIFVLDVPRKKYWQNATYKLNVDDFLQAIEDGTVEVKSAGKKGMEGKLEGGLTKFYNLLEAYQPWSVIVVVLFFVALAVAVVICITPGDDLRPPYPRQAPKPEATSDATASKVKGDGDESKNEEAKKDK